MDVTWDDPSNSSDESNVEKNPTAENYKYFLINLKGVNGDHYDDTTNYGRSVLSAVQIPHVKDMPDGWY